jgi:rhodanese-related sulfurtransferase
LSRRPTQPRRRARSVGAARCAPVACLRAAVLRDNAVVWDVRPADAYARGHIAGAVSIGDAPRIPRDDNTEDFIATDRIEKILGAAGLDPSRETIVYGSRGGWQPYFGLYTLRYFSGKNIRVFHEGIEGWTAASRPVSRDASQLPAVALKLEVNPAARLSVVGNAQIGYPSAQTDPASGVIVRGKAGIGTSTPATQLQVSSGANATTTVTVGELGLSSSKACVNMNQSNGSPGSFYIANGVMVVENNYCR